MGPRYRNAFISDQGKEWAWELWDDRTSSASTPIDVESASPGIELSYGSAGDPIYEPIKRLTIKIHWRIQSAAEEGILQAIARNQESRFFIKVFKGGDLECWGPVITDLIEIPNDSQPFDVILTAKDGLQILKEKKDPVNFTTAFELIMILLRSTDTGQLIGDEDPFCLTAVRYFEFTAHDHGVDPFARWRVSPLNSWQDPRKTEWESHYDALEKCLLAFNAHLMLSGGTWRITQFSDEEDGEITVNGYNRNYSINALMSESGKYLTNDVQYLTLTEGNPLLTAEILYGSKYSYLPQLKRAEREWKFDGGLTIWSRANHDTSTEALAGSVQDFGGDDTFIRLSSLFSIKLTSGASAAVAIYRRFDVQIKLVGSSQTWFYTDTGWATSYGTKTITTTAATIYPGQTISLPDSLQVNTSDLPGVGSVFIEIDLTLIPQSGNQQTIQLITVNEFKAVSITVEQLPDDLTDLREKILRVEDSAGSSSAEMILPTAQIGDGPSASSTKIEVWDGSAWQDSAAWRRERTGTQRNIITLQLEEIMRYFSQPRERHDMLLTGSMAAHQLLLYDSKRLKFNSYSIKAQEDLITAEMIELGRLATDFTPVEVTTTKQIITPMSGVGMQAGSFGNTLGLPISFLTDDLTGSSSGILFQALGFDGPVNGQKLIILDPATQISQEITLTEDVDASATEATISTVSISHDFPAGSLIMIQAQDLAEMAVRRVRGYISGLTVAAEKIGKTGEAVELDASAGDLRLDGQLALPNIQTSAEASTGEIYADGENNLKIKT
jgi:hypothetical protein